MKVVFDPAFHEVYSHDPASEPGRIQAIVQEIEDMAVFIAPEPATKEELLRAHSEDLLDEVRREGVFDIAALAAGAAILSARMSFKEPVFGLIRPPGHHASRDSCWGFCYFSNIAVALLAMKAEGLIQTAHVLDFDLHFGDGTTNILGPLPWVTLHNPMSRNRKDYLEDVESRLESLETDIIAISAGFDHHKDDWGGLLATEDYFNMGRWAKKASRRCKAGLFALLEGGYNHKVLGINARALMEGMASEP
ncbi:histone deacetylase family protein [Desulfobotulus mexicanus]|uniref:Histone deacetylase family protein n=1 Tax=Desulfobotulus mexicanus TaxID=2586642 RepID=A0A5Q4VET3_9BACT|nr:histone deacetylase family protein [Desulfobotulus mexicanus]TYT75478.1 histone deacetylase family protein [Desulfobotulus mexicanus]